MSKKSNFVFFVADQMRADTLAHLGSPGARTPCLDALAADGISYRNAYCQNPVCVPSRTSFLTGQYPHTRGHRTMHYLLRPEDPILFSSLKANGYKVLWIGKDEVVPIDGDFSQYCDEYYAGAFPWDREKSKIFEASYRGESTGDNFYSFFVGKLPPASESNDRSCIDYALDRIDWLAEKGEGPFAIFLFMSGPHPPYGCEEPWFSLIDRNAIAPRRPTPTDWRDKPSMLKGIYDRQQLQSWDEARFRELKAVYYGMVSEIDAMYGRVAERLRAHSLYDDTNILFFSDHGDFTGDYGLVEKAQNCFYDSLCNVPLIVKPSAQTPYSPHISNALVELLDIPQTVADLGGFELDYTQFGQSLRDTFDGSPQHKDFVFAEGGRIHGEWQAMEVGHTPESSYWPRLATQCSEGPEHTKAVMIREKRYKYIYRLYEGDELYDLEKDPMELQNLAKELDYQELGRCMRERLLQFMVETGDFVPNKKDRGY